MSTRLTIFCDTDFPSDAAELLRDGLRAHQHLRPRQAIRSNLVTSQSDPLILEADVAFGQPDPQSLLSAPRLGWAQLTSAGYTRYDEPEFRVAATQKGLKLTASSAVYADPCAEHVLAMMLAQARRLGDCFEDARVRAWHSAERRRQSFLLRGQTVLLLGFGSIARRLAQLLAPFEVQILALERTAGGNEPVQIIAEAGLEQALGKTDHLVNVLPENADTLGFVSATRLRALKRGAYVYNIGRGTTLDQDALCEALHDGAVAGAFLDVTEPEPLPPNHPLWSAPNCHISPHSAGGRNNEHVALVQHFLANLARFERGEPLRDQVI